MKSKVDNCSVHVVTMSYKQQCQFARSESLITFSMKGVKMVDESTAYARDNESLD